jgi:hypothetical protein
VYTHIHTHIHTYIHIYIYTPNQPHPYLLLVPIEPRTDGGQHDKVPDGPVSGDGDSEGGLVARGGELHGDDVDACVLGFWVVGGGWWLKGGV